MRSRALARLVPIAAFAVMATPALAAPARLESARVLRAKLATSGRAEVSVVHTLTDDLGGSAPRRAQLAIETPDRVRLAFADGEVLTMRGDGGEWLQPAANQMLMLAPEQLEVAARLWNVLLHGDQDAAWRETRTSPGRFTLVPVAGQGGEGPPFTSLTVTLGPDGLPRSLATLDGNQRLTLRFAGWRFTRPRGAAAFRLTAPPGVTVVPMR